MQSILFKFIFILIAFIPYTLPAQVLQWYKDYSWTVEVNNMFQTTGGNYVIAADVLFSVDSLGNYLWGIDYQHPWSYSMNLHSAAKADAGGFIISGTISTALDVYGFILKTDSLGNPLWCTTATEDCSAQSVIQTTGGAYIFVGSRNLPLNSGCFISKISSTGNILWSRVTDKPGQETFRSVYPAFDGGFIIAGYTTSFGAGDRDFLLVKTNSSGNTLWSKAIGGSNTDDGISVIQSPDSGYVICGSTESFGAGIADILIIKTDSVGTIQWSRTFGGTHYDIPRFIKSSGDGNFFIGGFTQSFTPPGFAELFLIKMTFNGDTLWSRSYGEGNVLDDIIETSDGGLLLGAMNYPNSELIKLDSMGLGGCYDQISFTIDTCSPSVVTPTWNSGFLSFTSVSMDTLHRTLLITNVCNLSGLGEEFDNTTISVFPNPFNDKLEISSSGSGINDLFIFDSLSRKIFSTRFSDSISINTIRLTKGVYFYKLINRNGILKSGKLIKL
ncbi:MAG: T9SS type A sorting domain-containing protein [Bacteroidetes bacterium]|nr:T9SS type A sorting domain-containing protein [Bacteroidota bacterium]